ncbi:hypothetical protein N8336_02150 [Flavobacteriaceae bacterium]|nr:hypothetical protein [Flavobacteriaceae bacterium]
MKNKIGAYIAYLKYLWRSSDQHSVHSPFVFELLTKCIHKVPKGAKTSAYNQAIKAYLEKKNIPLISPLTELTILETSLTNRGVTAYFVEEINADFKQKELWQKLISDKNIQITIDYWSFGLIFTKKDQEKEHFILFKNSWR